MLKKRNNNLLVFNNSLLNTLIFCNFKREYKWLNYEKYKSIKRIKRSGK